MKPRLTVQLLGASLSAPAHAYQGLDALSIQRMCQGADKARALSVMCHNYLNGYLDAAHHFNAKPRFCLPEGAKEKLPVTLVEWLKAHPEAHKQPAGPALERALTDLHPCKK